MVTLGPLTAPESPGVVPALRATCPAEQVKADLSHLYFSIYSSKTIHTIFYLRHHFVSDQLLNMPAPNFVAWKTRETSPCFKPCYRLGFFTTILNKCCLPRESPSHCSSPLYHTGKALPDRLFSHLFFLHCSLLPVLSCTAAWNQACTEKQSWMSPKQTLIWAFNCKFTSDGRFPVPYLHTGTNCTSGGPLMLFPVLPPTNLARFTLQNLINYGFASND